MSRRQHPISKVNKWNYLPFQILESNHISSCTSAGSELQLCKVSQNSNKPFRRSCAYEVYDPLFVKISVELSPLLNLYPVLYENIIHKAITDNFSLTELQFCTMFFKNVYSYLFSDSRGTILNYIHIYISPTSV